MSDKTQLYECLITQFSIKSAWRLIRHKQATMPWFRRYFLVKKELIRGLIPTLYQKKTEERYGFIRGTHYTDILFRIARFTVPTLFLLSPITQECSLVRLPMMPLTFRFYIWSGECLYYLCQQTNKDYSRVGMV